MKSKILIVLLVACALLLRPQHIVAEELPIQIIKKELTVPEMILEIAPKYGQSPALISKISFCESQHKIKSHDGGRGKNVTGIHDTTFNDWLPKYQKDTGETLDITSQYDQLKMMSWAFSKGDYYRNQWTTYVAYKNGGTYTFYSKLLKGTFTAHCK